MLNDMYGYDRVQGVHLSITVYSTLRNSRGWTKKYGSGGDTNDESILDARVPGTVVAAILHDEAIFMLSPYYSVCYTEIFNSLSLEMSRVPRPADRTAFFDWLVRVRFTIGRYHAGW
jgi:hypothetical protein